MQRVYRLQYNARKNGLVDLVHIPYTPPNFGGANQTIEQVISMMWTNICTVNAEVRIRNACSFEGVVKTDGEYK